MSLVESSVQVTTEEMLALPENGMDWELIRGEVREQPVILRQAEQATIMAILAHALGKWQVKRQKPRVRVVSGEAGFRLRRDPDTTVGIDVSYVSPEVAATLLSGFPYFDGPPVLAVEILSPSDTHQGVTEKIKVYQKCDVPIIWIVNPDDRTVIVYRRGSLPRLFNLQDELSCEPEMPGFRLPVADIFDYE